MYKNWGVCMYYIDMNGVIMKILISRFSDYEDIDIFGVIVKILI